MDLTPALQETLQNAEVGLRSLASSRALEGRYEAAQQAVEAAQALAVVLRGERPEAITLEVEEAQAPDSGPPRFLRHGEHLVEVRNPKGDGEAYHHRACWSDLSPVFKAMTRVAASDRRFTVPKVQDEMPRGSRVPRYQVYLALSFLMWSGLVRRQRRGEYSILVPGDELAATATTSWRQLPEAV